MGLLEKIKSDVKKSGSNKGKILFVREGAKARIRFLEDLDDGHIISFHDSFQKGVNVPCQEQFGRECPYCEDEDLRTRDMYVWSVYDYDSNSVKLFMYAVNNCSPIPALVSMYENYGTLTDRDYVISVTGKQQNKTFAVVPMDKEKFRNSKAKPFSKKSVLSILDKAYPADEEDEDEDDYRPVKKSKKAPKKKVKEIEEDDWDDEEEMDEEEIDYTEYSAKELYKMCKEREIECQPKKSAKYYINLLEEYDQAEDDWGDEEEDEDEDWED